MLRKPCYEDRTAEIPILYDKYQSCAVSCSSQHRMCYLPGSCMAGLASSIANFGQIYMKTENPGMPIIQQHCSYCQMSGIAVSFPLQLTPVNLCPQISDKVFRYLTLSETGCRTIFWASDGLRRTKRFFNLLCVIFTCPGTDCWSDLYTGTCTQVGTCGVHDDVDKLTRTDVQQNVHAQILLVSFILSPSQHTRTHALRTRARTQNKHRVLRLYKTGKTNK